MTEAVPYKFPKDRAEDARIEHQRQMDREYDEKFSTNQDNEKKVAIQKAKDQAKKFKEKMLRAQQAKTNALLIEVGRNGILIFILYVVSDALLRYIIFHLL
jgi:hypothetical protein|tara:strand:- start:134 stop:436 length:303 start_codon:yes stop_codon:yes gene_type:complete